MLFKKIQTDNSFLYVMNLNKNKMHSDVDNKEKINFLPTITQFVILWKLTPHKLVY